MGTKRIVAVGVAAAATAAVGLAAAKLKDRQGSAPVYHVTHDGDGWALKADGAERAASRHDTKKEAVQAGRDVASRAEGRLVIHGMDGAVQREHDYAPA